MILVSLNNEKRKGRRKAVLGKLVKVVRRSGDVIRGKQTRHAKILEELALLPRIRLCHQTNRLYKSCVHATVARPIYVFVCANSRP